MWLTKVFVHRPTLVFVLVALIALAGTLAYGQLVQQQYPNVDQPTVRILVSYPGASTTIMRNSVVEPLENALAGAQDLLTINSTVQTGQASIAVIFTLTSSVDTDLALVQNAVQSAQRYLPANIIAPTISLNNPSEIEVAVLQLTSRKLNVGQLSLLATGRIAPTIQQIPGVSYVTVQGAATPAYEVTVNPLRLSAAALTLTDLMSTISGNNVLAPGGSVYGTDRQTQVNIRGDIQSPESILDLPIQNSGTTAGGGIGALPGAVDPWTASDQALRVRDVATVVDGYEQPRQQFGQVAGKPSLILGVQKTSDASEVNSARAVIAAVPELRREFPNVDINVLNDDSIFAEQQIQSVIHTLIEGIVLTGLVMVFFLRSWRNAVVVLVSIPTSLCVAFFVMNLSGMTLDTVSLLGMTLVIGILVDDSTVVLENVSRHFELGQDPVTAAIEGRSEIGMAAIVITLVDVVVFLPIAFLPGQVGRNLYEFAAVIVISTLTSLFVSFTITPTLAGLWALESTWKAPWIVTSFTDAFERLRTWYADRVLAWALNHRALVIGVCAASFVISIMMIPLGFVGEEYIPPQDMGQIFVQLTWPVGTPMRTTAEGTFALEHAIDRIPDLQHESSNAGAYQASFGGFVTQPNVGQIHTWLIDARKHPTSYWVAQFQIMAAKIVPHAQAVVTPATGQGGGNVQPIDELVTDVSGGDPTAYAQRALQILQTTPGATNVNSSSAQPAPAVDVEFDRGRARALNVSVGTAASAAAAAFGGAVATQFETPAGTEQVQIVYPVSDLTNLAPLRAIPIRSTSGYVVHLGDVATINSDPAPLLITRTNRNDVIHVDANVAAGASLSKVQATFLARVAALHLPVNITVTPAPLGQQDLMNQTLRGIGASLVLSVVLVFLLMVALYNSYRSPLIILFAVPVATVGAVGSLMLTNSTLNLFSLIGTIMLVGIVTKNGILLVDYANTLRKLGKSKLAAVQESARTRFRPIVMTSVSVIAANIPLALGLEPGASVRASLGIVVIGGITSSLLLTLMLVPIMYMLISPNRLAEASREASPQKGVRPSFQQPDALGTVRPGA
jgi:hydrophobic/amphiphilic exporter-1 (mainly G- bacteria), HAE1 family